MATRKPEKTQPKDFLEDDLLDRYLELGEKWQKKLRLGAWEITFIIHPIPDNAAAQVDPDFIYRRATVCISPDIPDDELEQDIVHELLHVRIGETRALAELFLLANRRLTEERKDLLIFSEERSVDLLSRILIETDRQRR